jgi:hypothetical protein
MYFHNVEYNANISRLTNIVGELKKEVETMKVQLEQKHILIEKPENSFFTNVSNFFSKITKVKN